MENLIALVFLLSVVGFILASIFKYMKRDRAYPKINIEDKVIPVFIDRFVDDFVVDTKKSKKKGKDKDREEEFA